MRMVIHGGISMAMLTVLRVHPVFIIVQGIITDILLRIGSKQFAHILFLHQTNLSEIAEDRIVLAFLHQVVVAGQQRAIQAG